MDQPAAGPAPANSFCCPHLGLAGDRETRYLFPSPGHRCYAGRRPHDVTESHQATWCLAARHIGCSRFTRPVPAAERRTGLSGLLPVDDEAVPDPAPAAAPAPELAGGGTRPGADFYESVEAGEGEDEPGGVAAEPPRSRLAVLLFLVALVALAGALLIALGPPPSGAPAAATPLPTAPLPGRS